ncbi:MAG: tripartite tricarboxylate transporter TctB family protein [Betaproteobacteria bacterium]|nr:tripartite tricarboxylate transporter TctB family protein [Betaproteobacteria bacterium]
MKISDALAGLALVLLSLLILWHVRDFPDMPGQQYGPALFPGLLAAGIGLCGLLLVARGLRAADAWIAPPAWMSRSRPLAAFASVIGGLAFYVLAADAIGFHLVAFALMFGWTWILGARWRLALVAAVVVPVVLHLVFYKFLRVPLPWGLLESMVFR